MFAVHPRVGGERAPDNSRWSDVFGSSPRGRGTPYRNAGPTHCRRFIPAWAGNAACPFKCWRAKAVHPRVGGERARIMGYVHRSSGLSPRGRGTRSVAPIGRAGRRFIPAWAGNAAFCRLSAMGIPVHRRVGGERPNMVTPVETINGSSPRGRGTHICGCHHGAIFRFIPAWAGNARLLTSC